MEALSFPVRSRVARRDIISKHQAREPRIDMNSGFPALVRSTLRIPHASLFSNF